MNISKCLSQSNVIGWSNIVQGAAGGFHTIGLKSYGRVVAIGDNSQSQIQFHGWNFIVTTPCKGDYHEDGDVEAVDLVPQPGVGISSANSGNDVSLSSVDEDFGRSDDPTSRVELI